ncbi:MAG: C10 family peptidase [Planctomycetota bacterium]
MAAVHRTFRLQAMVGEAPFTYTQRKWSFFISLAETSEGGFNLMGRSSIPDVRVAPLVQSKWSQQQVCDNDCYNYYTPYNHPSGCTATAMAQLMRYYKHPTTGIGVQEFTIQVDDVERTASTRGGDGNGGPYKWDRMVLEPGCSTTLAQRKAIGALCYDAGVSAETDYSADGSGASLYKARDALKNTFKYGNAISGLNYDYSAEVFRDLGSGLEGMVNPNLDAGHPVVLGLKSEEADARHAILADGYGYNSSTPYHHLNMGWGGIDDAWYSLPIIDSDPSYNVVDESIYNIFTSGSGEIISGRVTDAYGSPISGATVTARRQGRSETYTDETDSKGIYALEKVKSQSAYTVSVTKSEYSFPSEDVHTGKSENYEPVSGNRWGVDFKAGLPPSGPMEDFETNNFRKFLWEHEGDIHWTTTPWEKHSGNYSAQAGSIDHDEITTLKVTLNCVAGDISFYRKIYSEVGCDYLTFYIDGVEKDTWSGEEDWAEVSFPVTAGTRTFEWTYSKDGSVSEGDDTAWIDDIVFPVVSSP